MEVEDWEDVVVDEEVEVAVVGNTALITLPSSPPELEVVEDEEDEEDTEDVDVLSTVVAVVAEVVAAVVATEGLAPAPMIGWGLESPSWGTGARFLRKRLWLTW